MNGRADNPPPGIRILRQSDLDAGDGLGLVAERLAILTHLPDGQGSRGAALLRIAPGGQTAAHDHGPEEVLVHVLTGAIRIRWGPGLESDALVVAGTSAIVPPGLHHQEINASRAEEARLLLLGDPATPGSAGLHEPEN